MSGYYRPGDSYYAEFTTSDPISGALADADATPTVSATRNGVADLTFTLTVTRLGTGNYRVTGTVPSGYAERDRVYVSASAAVGGVAGMAKIDDFAVGGVWLSADGWDAIVPESGYNARQLLALIAAAACGNGTGFDTSTPAYGAVGAPATARITATVSSSSRTVTLNPPT